MSDLFDDLTEKTDAISLAKKMCDDVQSTYYDIGCILYNLRERDLYKTIEQKRYYSDTHSKWKEFCTENFSVSYRSCQYWLNIYRYFEMMEVPKERLIEIGWSKSKELIDLTDDTNVLEKAMQIAKDGTIQQVKAHVAEVKNSKELSGEDTREEVKAKTFNFKFYEAAGETVEQILQEAAQDTGGNLNEAMFKICIEWLQNKNHVPSMDDYILAVDGETYENGEPLSAELLELVGV